MSAPLREASALLRIHITECGRMGVSDRKFWLKIDGQVYVIRCRAFRHPAAICRATERLMGATPGEPWLTQRDARHVLALLHAAADAHELSSPSAVKPRRGVGVGAA